MMLCMMKNQRSFYIFFVLVGFIATVPGMIGMPFALDGSVRGNNDDDHHRNLKEVINDDQQKRRLSEAIHSINKQIKDNIVTTSRYLQYTPTTRVCDEEIGTVTASEIRAMATVFLQAIFPNPEDAGILTLASAVLLGQVQQDIKLVKVCMTCEEAQDLLEADGSIAMNGQEDNNSKYSFQNICADGMYGVNETESAIAFIPKLPLEEGSAMRGLIFGRGTTIPQDFASSERVPADWTQYMADNIDDPGTIVFEQLDVFVPAAFGAVGSVSIMPDFLGYGESYMVDRPFLHKELYARSYILTYLATREYIRIQSQGCSDLEPTVTVGGYSEGGYSTIPGALGLQSIGVTILGAYPGGSVFQPGIQTGYFMELISNVTLPPDSADVIGLLGTYYGYSMSNEFPFLVNTGTGQYVLSDEYRQGDITNNALLWYQSPAELGWGVIPFLPIDDLLSTINPDLIAVYDEARQLGIEDACASDLATSSATINKLCEAIDLQNMIPELETVDFPTIICHSPDDEVVTYKNVPTFPFVNPNVSLYAGIPELNILVPQGSHFEGALYCGISPILALQDASENSPAYITPMEMCLPDYAAPPTDTTPPPTPSPVQDSIMPSMEASPSVAPVVETPAPDDTGDNTPSPAIAPTDSTSGTMSRPTWTAISTCCILSTALALFFVA